MDYTQFLSMTEELSLLAVIVILFLADLFLCGKDEKELSACTADGASLSSCGCNFRTAFPVILLLVHTALNLLPCCNGSLEPASAFGGMYQHTPMMTIVKSVLNIGVIVVFLMSSKWLNSAENRIKMGEFHTVVLFTLLGMYFMISSGHFIMFFIGLELASIPMAALVAYDKKSQESAEAGGKFILLALFSSALLLYGISLIYGVTGTLYFDEIGSRLSLNLLSILGLVLFISGMGFKISLVPFHLWTADTYEGAPTVVTGYLSVISKGSAAFVLMTILVKLFGAEAFQGMWSVGFFWIILASITIANLFAIRQKNLKRFMAFSSISQAGYILLGVIAGSAVGMTSLIYYVLVYVFSNLAVFGVISVIENATGKVDMDDYNGLYRTNPKLSVALMLALFSLAGIPPFAGFFSKFFIFYAAVEEGFYVLVFIALLNTIISLYYYLLVVKAMFIRQDDCVIPTIQSDGASKLSISLCVLGVLLVGLISGIYSSIVPLSFGM